MVKVSVGGLELEVVSCNACGDPETWQPCYPECCRAARGYFACTNPHCAEYDWYVAECKEKHRRQRLLEATDASIEANAELLSRLAK